MAEREHAQVRGRQRPHGEQAAHAAVPDQVQVLDRVRAGIIRRVPRARREVRVIELAVQP